MTATDSNNANDKLELHHRQQLSALMDGALVADEARFLLRRLQHDRELTGCWERWQLCGELLRGRAGALAPEGFAERVARAVAAETSVAPAPAANARNARGLLARWGGGALAASVALVALFMARQQTPQDAPAEGPQLASQSQQAPAVPSPVPETPSPAAPDAEAYAAAAAMAVASVPRRQDAAARRSATRTQQAARAAQRVARAEAPVRAVAGATASPSAVTALAATPSTTHVAANPFSPSATQQAVIPQARPWPRSALPGYPATASGALTTGYSSDSAARTFYPFEPRLPATPPVAPPETAPRE